MNELTSQAGDVLNFNEPFHKMTFVADRKYYDVCIELKARGWTQCPILSSRHFDLKWRNARNINFANIKSHQVVNHFPASNCLSVKRHFCLQIRSAKDYHTFYPKCWALDDTADMHCFLRDFALSCSKALLLRFIDLIQKNIKFTSDNGQQKIDLCEENVEYFSSNFNIPLLQVCVIICEKISNYPRDYIIPSNDWEFILYLYTFGSSVDELWSSLSNREKCVDTKIVENKIMDLANLTDLIQRAKLCDLTWQKWQLSGECGIWIAKPGAAARGEGIELITDVCKYLKFI